MIQIIEIDGAIGFVADPHEPLPVGVADAGVGLSGIVTLVGGKYLGLGDLIVVWPTGTEVSLTGGQLTLIRDGQSAAVGDPIDAGMILAGLDATDQDELTRHLPRDWPREQVVLVPGWAPSPPWMSYRSNGQ